MLSYDVLMRYIDPFYGQIFHW